MPRTPSWPRTGAASPATSRGSSDRSVAAVDAAATRALS
jgi:hypothetical protein